MKCIDCDKPATMVDTDYDEGYCDEHFAQWQRSSEPIVNYRAVED